MHNIKNSSSLLLKAINALFEVKNLSTSTVICAWKANNEGPNKWLRRNNIIHPPQLPDEEKRQAYVCHMKTNIKYSPFKMWYIASFIRGMPVEEAIRQLKFVPKKGSQYIIDTLEEAKELAVNEHNVEFNKDMWVAESFVGKGKVFRGFRRHARGRVGRVEYFHCHYFVKLQEGNPPKHYYPHVQPEEQFENWLKKMRNRRIYNSL